MTTRARFRAKGDRSPRISDVAKLAGVSTATVSRTIASPQQVRPKLRQKVEDAIQSLGYTPHAGARSLRAGQTKMILVMTRQRWSAPFFSEILHGIDAVLTRHGYSMILANLDDGPKERHAVEMMLSGRFDGAIILSGQLPASAGGGDVRDTGLPLVSICAAVEGTHAVLTDEMECIVRGAQHLVDLGHEQLLYIAGPKDNPNEMDRWHALEAFFASPENAQLSLQRVEGNFTFRSGTEAAQTYMNLSRRPTGVIACSDELAIGFMKNVQAAGLRVPQDVSVVGFDGIEFAEFCEPTLTTICQPRFALGQAGARVLIDKIQGGSGLESNPLILPSWLTVCHSTGPAPRQL